MSKKPVVFCRDCKFSATDPNGAWQLRCHNPEVNRKDGWALGCAETFRGVECVTERRDNGWFSVCGMKGKQYEPKEEKQ